MGLHTKRCEDTLNPMGGKVSKNFTYNFVDRFKGTKIEEQDGRIFRKE
jgi:hypothetical protein